MLLLGIELHHLQIRSIHSLDRTYDVYVYTRSAKTHVRSYVGLARTIYIRCTYGIFGREITKYTVIYGAYLRFWPTLVICIRVWSEISIYVYGRYAIFVCTIPANPMYVVCYALFFVCTIPANPMYVVCYVLRSTCSHFVCACCLVCEYLRYVLRVVCYA